MTLFFLKKYQFLFLLSVSLISSTYAFQNQDSYLDEPIEQRNFDEKQWKKITSGIDYSEDIGDELEKRKDKKRETQAPTAPWTPSEGLLTFFKFLFLFLSIVGVAIILGYFIGAFTNTPKNKKIKNTSVKTLDLEQIEENIHETDLEQFIQKAVAEGQYNIAIRLYYLLIIKELSLKSHIDWKKDKTNSDYLREVENLDFSQLFRDITLVYERAWYGNTLPQEEDYVSIKNSFEGLIQQIRT